MKWYKKKFSEFFQKWKKGDLLLQNNEGYFGEIEAFELADEFENSTIKFLCFQPSGEEKTFALKEIRHYHALNGPILNIGKYVKIVKLGEQSHLSVVKDRESDEKKPAKVIKLIASDMKLENEEGDEEDDKEDKEKAICIVFGLEFYTTEKRARILQRDVKEILLSRLEDTTPILSVEDRDAVDLTPTFTKVWSRILGVFRRGSKQYRGKHIPEIKSAQITSSSSQKKEKVRT